MSRTTRNLARWHRKFRYRHKLGEPGKTLTDRDDVPVAALKEVHRSKHPQQLRYD
jgi:hypothetical protein